MPGAASSHLQRGFKFGTVRKNAAVCVAVATFVFIMNNSRNSE